MTTAITERLPDVLLCRPFLFCLGNYFLPDTGRYFGEVEKNPQDADENAAIREFSAKRENNRLNG